MTQARRITKKRMETASEIAAARNQIVRLKPDGSIEFDPAITSAEADEAAENERRMQEQMGGPAR